VKKCATESENRESQLENLFTGAEKRAVGETQSENRQADTALQRKKQPIEKYMGSTLTTCNSDLIEELTWDRLGIHHR
jgi:hypothetical protein